MAATVDPTSASADPGGLTGFALDVVDRLGELGIGLLVIAETVFPPIPCEVVLPLGGYLANRGRLDLLLVVLTATAGSLIGSLLLYALGLRLGRRRAVAALAPRMPLLTFSLLTLLGSTVWNALLIGVGYALGTQFHLVEQYTGWLDAVLYLVIVLAVTWLVFRRVRRRRLS